MANLPLPPVDPAEWLVQGLSVTIITYLQIKAFHLVVGTGLSVPEDTESSCLSKEMALGEDGPMG